MDVKNRRGPHTHARRLFLLLAVACCVGIILLSRSGASAQTDPPPVHEIAFERDGLIYVMKADGERQPRLITSATRGGGNDPAWSPDGTRIAYHKGGEIINIYTIDAAGTELPQPVTNLDIDYEGHRNLQAAYFPPDGQQIAYTRGSYVDNVSRVYLISAAGGMPVPLATGLNESLDPAFSPDGKKIAFASGATGFNDENLYVMTLDGSAPMLQLTFDAAGNRRPAFSPDGQKIAYSKGGDIWVMNADGTGQTNLTNTPNTLEDAPAYSPDNARMAFSSRPSGTTDFTIHIMDTNGANRVPTGEAGRLPAWKPIPGLEPGPGPTPPPTPPPTPEPTPEADLSVQLSAAPNPVAVGQNLIYTLIVKNNGPQAAEGVQTYLLRSASLQYVSASPAQGTCGAADANPLYCQLGQLGAGAQVSIQFVVKPTAAEEVVAFVGASSAVSDGDLNNNQQQLKLTVKADCVSEVTGEVQQFIKRPGNQSRQNLKHTIQVRNTSGRQLHGLVHLVFDGLPSSVEDGRKYSTFFRTRCAQPLGRKFTSVLRNLTWEPGEVIEVDVDFSNPDRVPVNYNLRVYTGPGYP